MIYANVKFHPNDAQTYAFTWEGEEELRVGDTVAVETKRGESQGFVASTTTKRPKLGANVKLRPVLRILERKP